MEKSGRFNDNKSAVSAECSLSISSKSTGNVVAIFSTPQPPRTKITTRPCSKTKLRALVSSCDSKLKYKSEHQLADLQIECENKNKTIQEHEKHMEEMKEGQRNLESQLEELRRKQTEVDDQYRKDIETMATLQLEVLNNYDEQHQAEMENLRCQFLEISEEKEDEIRARKTMEGDLRNRIEDLTKSITILESELEMKKQANKEKVQMLETKIEKLVMKLEKLNETHKQEVSSLEQEKSDLNSCISSLTDQIAECEERLRKTIADSDKKVSESYVHKMHTSLEYCFLNIYQELQLIFNVRYSMESFGQSLQMELDRAETELAEKKEELRALKDQIRAEAAEMVARRKRFEVIMAENQASVAALAKRLAQSNAEVERLQRELKRGEDCINEHRNLLNIMRNNSQMVHVQVHALMEQLDVKKGLVNQLEVESLSEVEAIRSIFEAKIEDLRQIVSKEVTKLQADCEAKDAQNIEMKNQLHEMANHLNGAQDMLLELEERNDAQELEISRANLLSCKLNEQLKKSNLAVEETNQLLDTQSIKHKAAIDEVNKRIQELSNTIKALEKMDGVAQDKTEAFEEEKVRRETAEEEVKKILEHNARLTKDHQEISKKYAELIGHQNHRQRIKHVSQLKDKINQLEQDLHVKAKKIEQQQKTIEKLKMEEKRMHNKGKENVIGVSKNAHTTPVSSPLKPLTPLRNRND
ncbi:Laminin-like protein epi-1 [Dufourea novaeangliae]|uniref:Laminin-like protein epi-1 n=1 Tax=Dufourea novaeangliae TaxID=178035 RepID=A0A154PCJ1_DUFNO|nr:Laminin-like protein epi-1 [Dufourea novaeangliae]